MPAEKPEESAEARTTIDALMELLQAKGKMDVSEIASTLGIAPSIVENWSKVLETGGMVRISYEVGRMNVAPITVSAEQVKLVESRMEVKRGLVEEKVVTQRTEIEKFAAEISNLSTEVSSLERIYQQRMPAVQQMLMQINTLYDSIIEQGRTVERIKRTAEDSYQSVNKNIDELYSKIETLSNTEVTAGQGKGVTAVTTGTGEAQDAIKNAKEAYDALVSLSSAKDRVFDSLLDDVDDQVADLKKQIAAKKKEVDAQMGTSSASVSRNLSKLKNQGSESKALVEQLKNFKKDMDRTKRTLTTARVQFTDRYEKIEESMKASTELLDQNSKDVLGKLNDLKMAFGDVVKVDSTLHDAKKSIETINKEIEESRASVSDLQKSLQAFAAMTVTLEQRMNITTEIEKKVDKTDEKLSGIKKSIKDTENKFNEGK